MSELPAVSATAQKWDQKYADATVQTPAKPCFVLKQHSGLLPFKGRALELACGLGGNARFLAQCGLKTQAWDISDSALTVLNNWASLNQLPIEPLITDLEQMLLPYQQFDVIVISRYLDRKLFPQIRDALKPGGLLYYQTFLSPVQENAPTNPDFYIHSGEFNQAWPELHTRVYGEGWLPNENDASEQPLRHRYAWYVGQKA
ncbi:class I SAM-dependent methyltransferase [Thiomicrorhabdus sp. zzn3]|uniref:class I SAM-dependent methyltransferase n=1 Tax=Thiomicrorhabdus sp. zzn3 TaxID=3039775 RepID=UPI0024373FE4|nr:class I SAM-dependent methyltransferase [Thiomicrorhabdus sp. zzn3]MDG6778936.1 class I SAM-dependent methyltransferase [Thiomicrorhabdus sp. zzn3]